MHKAIEDVRAAMRAYAGGEDSPPMRVCNGLLALANDLDAKMDALHSQPVADVERLVREMLHKIRPEFERRWRWQRWTVVLTGCAAGLAAWTLALGLLTYHVGRDVGAADSARWSAWCSDRVHIVLQNGGAMCQVPVTSKTH